MIHLELRLDKGLSNSLTRMLEFPPNKPLQGASSMYWMLYININLEKKQCLSKIFDGQRTRRGTGAYLSDSSQIWVALGLGIKLDDYRRLDSDSDLSMITSVSLKNSLVQLELPLVKNRIRISKRNMAVAGGCGNSVVCVANNWQWALWASGPHSSCVHYSVDTSWFYICSLYCICI